MSLHVRFTLRAIVMTPFSSSRLVLWFGVAEIRGKDDGAAMRLAEALKFGSACVCSDGVSNGHEEARHGQLHSFHVKRFFTQM